MKRIVMMTGVGLVLASAAFARGHKPRTQKVSRSSTPTTIQCAVMTGNPVNVKEATLNHQYADYKGNRYYFCCGTCPVMFKSDPARYARNAHTPVPKKI